MKIVILGAGRSGLAAARLAKRQNYDVFVSEFQPATKAADAERELRERGIGCEFGGHSRDLLNDADLIVVSPGIPPQADIIRRAEDLNIPLISELEFAWRHMRGRNRFIAITGTNGKTTCTSLTVAILEHAGKKAYAAGNIGLALSDLAGTIEDGAIVVVEASSYQLDRIDTFQPDVAIILNITPDHLSYHGSMQSYREAKYKIFSQQSNQNIVISSADDEHMRSHPPGGSGMRLQFGLGEVEQGAFVREGQIVFRTSTKQQQEQPQGSPPARSNMHLEEELMPSSDIGIPGVHNLYNSMAAALAARAFEVRNEDIRDCLLGFSGVEHRLESVRTFQGVEFVNDSKATNINASWYALGSYDRPLIWIAGGRGDGNDYDMLDEHVRRRVKCILAIGEESRAIFNHFCGMTRCLEMPDLESAVVQAMQLAEPAELVLFSPACKSFDMFPNFEVRGDAFKQHVRNLA